MGKEQIDRTTWIERYAEERSRRDPAFKAGFEEEQAVLALVRARNAAQLSQQEVAVALGVSQPYVAMIERGSKPMSLSLMVRYANVVGLRVNLAPRDGKHPIGI
jgi:DNA-binding XRE family transcriptional regulator